MFGIRRLLVGVDVTASGDGATSDGLSLPTRSTVNLALRMAEFSKARITFLNVVDGARRSTAVDEHKERRASLDALVGEAAERGISAEVQLAVGCAETEIVREVLRGEQQLVIVGSRRQSGAQRFLLGSTGMALLRSCPCPVWVVRDIETPEVPTVIAADDLTPVGERCLELGVSAARLLDARLLVLHAVQLPLEGPLRRAGTSPQELEVYRENSCRDAERSLTERLSMTDHRTISAGTRIDVIPGPADTVIEDAIAEHAATLLVMGTIGRGGIPGLLVGNTAERLLPVIPCSLLTVKPDDFVCPISLD
ncbi:MAG: universal stress protein [Planctomycetaceae bacterium]|nr:universal stress protein [Planctomycetaceae bacterium]